MNGSTDIEHVVVVCKFFKKHQVLKNLDLDDIDNLNIVLHSSTPVGRLNESSLIFVENLDHIDYTTFENIRKVYMYNSNIRSNYVKLYENYAWKYFPTFEDFIKVTHDSCCIEEHSVMPIKYDGEPDINLLNRCLRLYSGGWKRMQYKTYNFLTLTKLEGYMSIMDDMSIIDKQDFWKQLTLDFDNNTKNMFIKLYNSMDGLKASIKSNDDKKYMSLCNMLKFYHKEESIKRETMKIKASIESENNKERLITSIKEKNTLESIVGLLCNETVSPVDLYSRVECLLNRIDVDILTVEGCSKDNVIFKRKGKIIPNKIRDEYIIYDKTKVFNEDDSPYMNDLWLSISSKAITICK